MPPDSQSVGLVSTSPTDVQRRAVAVHPGGQAYLDRLDRRIDTMVRHERFRAAVLDPLFAWPFAAAVTQFIIG